MLTPDWCWAPSQQFPVHLLPVYVLRGCFMLWIVPLASCPGHAPSQLPVHLLSSRAWETEKSLTYLKYYSTTTKTSVVSTLFSSRIQIHSTIPPTKKKINSIPANTRTLQYAAHTEIPIRTSWYSGPNLQISLMQSHTAFRKHSKNKTRSSDFTKFYRFYKNIIHYKNVSIKPYKALKMCNIL